MMARRGGKDGGRTVGLHFLKKEEDEVSQYRKHDCMRHSGLGPDRRRSVLGGAD